MADVTEQDLARYFAAREEQRRDDIAQALPDLEQQMRTFLAEHGTDTDTPALLAGMIREAAVIAYGRGVWQTGGTGKDEPPRSVVFYDTLHYCRSFDDICPAWRVFDGRNEEDDDA